MSNYSLDAIDNETFVNARMSARKRIEVHRRAAEAARLIAANFDGVYITKRIEDKILALIPGAKRVWFDQGKYAYNVSVRISYTETYCSDDPGDEIRLCPKNNRRLDAEKLIEYAKREELEAMSRENLMGRIDGIVEQYNAIAKQYAAIENDLNAFFHHSLPYSDSTFERIAEEEAAPEKFLESITA